MNNIFIIRSVEFDQQKEDPFGFDNGAGRIADKYLTFSGVIRKPIYLVFISIVNRLLETKQLHCSIKSKTDIKIRLEKFLVSSWKRNKNLRGKSVIGNRIRNINPFEARDGNWVIQNCYKIYEASVRELDLESITIYYLNNNDGEIKLLNEFLSKSGHLSKNNRYINNLLTKLSKRRTSLFCGNTIMAPKLRKMFGKALKESVKSGNFRNDQSFVNKIFSKPLQSNNQINKILHSSKYPFRAYNNWVRNFVLAVDADINGFNSKLAWQNAGRSFKEMKNDNYKERPEPRCWFELNNNKYITGKDFDSTGWNAVLKRAKRKDGNFYDFKLNALSSLLKETSVNE